MSTKEPVYTEAQIADKLATLPGWYYENGGIAGTLFAFSIVLWLLSGTLVRWMHGAEKVTH